MTRPSSRFPLAVHLLVALSYKPGEYVSSESLAGTAQTNPVVVRRVLARLQEAGLARSQTGVAGGATLARAARRISLLDVYRAVDEGSIFCMHSPNPRCPIGSRIPAVLGTFLPKVEEAMEGALRRVSIQEVARAVLPSYRVPKRRKGVTT